MRKAPGSYFLGTAIRAVTLFAVLMLCASCGYSLELSRVDAQKQEDPITLLRRELRQVKADHRVAIFDLRKEQKMQLSELQNEQVEIAKKNRGLGKNVAQFVQRNADVDERFSEMEVQHRLIHGRIEEEANRYKDVSARASDFTLREIEAVRKDLAKQAAKLKQAQKSFKDQMVSLGRKEEQAIKEMRSEIDSVNEKSLGIQKATAGQKKSVQSVSDQLSQVVDKILPAVNRVTERLDALEWEFKKLDENIDVQALNRRMTQLTDAINVQRQSLEMLGNTLTSQVDKQRGLLRQVIDRLDDSEEKGSSKK